MLRPAWSVTRLAIPQADKADFSAFVSERFIEHPQVDTSKGVFAGGCRAQLLWHYVHAPGALLDPKKLLPPIFAGEVDGFFEEFFLHKWQVDFHAQSALQTGFRKEQITAASAARNRHISRN